MSNVTGTVRGKVVITGSSNPVIINAVLALANTEVEIVLPDLTRQFLIRCRDNATLKLAFQTGATEFITIPAGASYTEEGLQFSGSLFVTSSKPTQVAEVVAWT
jgi:hypothetical protein